MKISSVCRWLAGFAVLTAPLALLAAPQVKTASGMIEGKEDGAVRAFLGIPYAAPPVGDLRWKPPAAAANWRQGPGADSFRAPVGR